MVRLGDVGVALTSVAVYYNNNTPGRPSEMLMDHRLSPILFRAGRAAIVLLTVHVAAVSLLRYVGSSLPAPAPILANAFASPFLTIHVVAGVIALLIGPLQFVRRVRARRPALHRAMGLIYVGACAVSAPAAFMLALGTTAGPVAGTGFAMLAVLLALFTYLGLRAAIDRRFADHREWMLRSYALTATAITLRLMLPAAGLLGLDFLAAYQAIAWLSWIANLALVEYHIRRTRNGATTYAMLATA
jgi:uncharacterized membrane protein